MMNFMVVRVIKIFREKGGKIGNRKFDIVIVKLFYLNVLRNKIKIIFIFLLIFYF